MTLAATDGTYGKFGVAIYIVILCLEGCDIVILMVRTMGAPIQLSKISTSLMLLSKQPPPLFNHFSTPKLSLQTSPQDAQYASMIISAIHLRHQFVSGWFMISLPRARS